MQAKSKKTTTRSKKTPTPEPKKTIRYRLRRWWHNLRQHQRHYLERRPHRSFRLTGRRDYRRSLKLPGYWSLTIQVWKILINNKKIFLSLVALFVIMAVLFSSLMSQDAYSQLKDIVKDTGEEGLLSGAASTLTLFWGVVVSQVSNQPGSSQQIIAALLGLFLWLTTVWLMRALVAGKKPRMRDGLYSSGGPVIALAVLTLVLVIQLLPAAIALIVYGAMDASGLLTNTAILMLSGGVAILIATLSLYWMVSTLFAMVIVMLPGMYPLEALRLAGDLVISRRVRILFRLLWALVVLLIVWVVVLIPFIMLEQPLVKAIPVFEQVPLVPFVALALMTFSIMFIAAYIYVFYRKVVDDDAAPA